MTATETAPRTWWNDLYDGWLVPDPQWQRDWAFMREWVTVRYDVAKRLQPQTIVEIGVRAGYSAFAFLAGAPDAQYVGIDTWGFPGYSDDTHLLHASKLLAGKRASLLRTNSQHLQALPVRDPDLVHVDGEHSEMGCYRDCVISRQSGARHILVDDVLGIDIVRRGAQRFIDEYKLTYELVDPGQQGARLIRCRD